MASDELLRGGIRGLRSCLGEGAAIKGGVGVGELERALARKWADEEISSMAGMVSLGGSNNKDCGCAFRRCFLEICIGDGGGEAWACGVWPPIVNED